MPIIIDSDIEASVLTLHSLKFSQRAIQTHLRRRGTRISVSAVHSIVHGFGKRREAKARGEQFKSKGNRTVRTERAIRIVKKACEKENPPTHQYLATRMSCSKSSVNRMIHEDLRKKKRKKPAVHPLTEIQMRARASRLQNLLDTELTEDNLEYCCTIDESWLYLQHCNHTSDICYVNEGEAVPADWVRLKDERFGEKVMAVGVLTGRGAVPLFFVPPGAKVNSDVYIDHVLRPLVEKHLPALYPGEMHKVWVHHDGAKAHTSKKTQAFCNEVTESTGVRFIQADEIPTKSPDVAPLDFFGFGYLKGKLRSKRVRTLARLKRAAQDIWKGISQELVMRVFAAWRERAKEIVKARGRYIENVKHIHNKQVLQ